MSGSDASGIRETMIARKACDHEYRAQHITGTTAAAATLLLQLQLPLLLLLLLLLLSLQLLLLLLLPLSLPLPILTLLLSQLRLPLLLLLLLALLLLTLLITLLHSPCLMAAEPHDDVIKWKHFPRYLPFVREIQRLPVNSTHKGQWRGVLIFSFICAWTNNWVNNGDAGDLRRNRSHYDVIVMQEYRCRAMCKIFI